MCPACFSSVAWLLTSGISVLGGTAGGLAIVRDRKIATSISKVWKLTTREFAAGKELTRQKNRGAWQCKNE